MVQWKEHNLKIRYMGVDPRFSTGWQVTESIQALVSSV